MFKKVVVPLDGSELATNIYPYLSQFLPPDKTHITLVTAIELWHYARTTDSIGSANLLTIMRESAKAHLQQQATELTNRGFSVSTHLTIGDAAGEILKLVEETGSDLIAMTTHGRSGIARWALGSVAERVIHHTPVPVLLVRDAVERAAQPLDRILVPLDGSDLAEEALLAAERLAQETDAEIVLVQAIQPLDETNQEIIFGNQEAADQAFKQWHGDADDYLHRVWQTVQEKDIRCTYEIPLSDPANSICHIAVEKNADMIVMSTHGRSGVGRWLYGSVASKVLQNSTCPLLLVRSTQIGERATEGAS